MGVVLEAGRNFHDRHIDTLISGDFSRIPSQIRYLQFLIAWEDLEPLAEQWEFTRLDALLNALRVDGRQAILRLDCSPGDYPANNGYPAWLLDSFPASQKREIPYQDPQGSTRMEIRYDNPEFQRLLARFLTALADRYDGHNQIEYIDIRVVGNFGEWAGWEDDHHFSFLNQRDTLHKILTMYTSVFKNTLLAMEISGGQSYRGDPWSRVRNWSYDALFDLRIGNLMARTDTNTSGMDYFSRAPTDQFLNSWLLDAIYPLRLTTSEGAGAWRDYFRKIQNTTQYIDNALYRFHSNFIGFNLLDGDHWPLLEEICGGNLDRLGRNMGYRVRPAHVLVVVTGSGDDFMITIDHTWVNGGYGVVPSGYWPAIAIREVGTGRILAQRLVNTPGAELRRLRNQDFVEIRSKIALRLKPHTMVEVILSSVHVCSGDSLPLAVDGGKQVFAGVLTIADHGSVDSVAGDCILSSEQWMSSLQGAWLQGGRIRRIQGGEFYSPKAEGVEKFSSVIFEAVEIFSPGEYRIGVDLVGGGQGSLILELDGHHVAAFHLTSTLVALRRTLSAPVAIMSGMHQLSVTATEINDVRLVGIAFVIEGPSQVPFSGAVFHTSAQALSQWSVREAPLAEMTWFAEYYVALHGMPDKARINSSTIIYVPGAELSGADAGTIATILPGNWIGFGSCFVKYSGEYGMVLMLWAKNGFEMDVRIDSEEAAVVRVENLEPTRLTEVEIGPFQLRGGVHDVSFHLRRAQSAVMISFFEFREN